MNKPEDLIEAIPGIRKNLAEEIDAEEWSNARVSMWQLSDSLDYLRECMDKTDDVDAYNALCDEYNDALEQWNDAATQVLAGLEQQR